MTINISVKYLRIITLLVILTPFFPFFIGWMKPLYGVLMSLILLFSFWQYLRHQRSTNSISVPLINLFVIAAGVFVFVGLSGSGGFGTQVADYNKQNAIIKDLIDQQWPLTYSLNNERVFLATYMGYYVLIPSIFGGMGWKWVNLFYFFYSYGITLIAVLWLFRFAKNFKKAGVLFLLFFSGISLFSFVALHGFEFLNVLKENIKDDKHFFWLNAWNTLPLNYLGAFEQLRWSPQHTLPTWLLIGLMLNDWFVDDDVKFMPFYLSLLVLWSPIVMVGFFPYLLLMILQKGFRPILNTTNLVMAPVIFGMVALMILSIEAGSFPKHFIFKYDNTVGNGLVQKILVYIGFLFFEVIVWFVPVYFILKNKLSQSERQLLWFCGVLLCTIPLFRYGLWNDWVGRVSMPSLVILLAFTWRAFGQATARWRGALLGILVLAAMSPLAQLTSSFRAMGYKIAFKPQPVKQVLDLPSVCVGYSLDQFVAKENTFFYKYIAKEKSK